MDIGHRAHDGSNSPVHQVGTTSADSDFLTTDADFDDEDEALGALLRTSVASVVIVEDDEGISDDGFDEAADFSVDGSEMRRRLWAQSLLRLTRSIDEIYSLCEYESDEIMCEQVRQMLVAASQDFVSLNSRFESQQEYTLLPGEFPFKTGVAWTTRTPKASRVGEGPLDVLERTQSPTSNSARSRTEFGRKSEAPKSRSRSLDPQKNRASEELTHETDAGTGAFALASGGTGETVGGLMESARSESLDVFVQSALQRLQDRLGRPSKLNPEEVLKRSEARQRRARQLRAEQEEHRTQQLRQLGDRVWAAREKREQREQQKQRQLLEKMTRARRQYQDQLRIICERARNENRKASEVAFITKEALKIDKEFSRQKQENARLARALLREQTKNRQIENANRIAKVSENKRQQEEKWQNKVLQELEEKERLASLRRKQHIHSIRKKSKEQENHSETVREKRREIQEEDERSTLQQQQDFLHIRSKNIGRMAMNVEGLPDGVREEVVEQLQGVAPRPTTVLVGRGRSTRGKSTQVGRCSTPPRQRLQTESLKSSPKSDAPISDVDEFLQLNAPPLRAKAQVKSQRSRKSAASSHPINSKEEVAIIEGQTRELDLTVDAGEEDIGNEDCCQVVQDRVCTEDEADVTEDDAFSEQDGMDIGDSTLTEGINPIPQLPGSKSMVRTKAKADTKDSRFRNAPVEISIGQADSEHHQTEEVLEALRKQLSAEALSDEEALKIVMQPEGGRAVAVNAAHRAKISKLATDLGRVVPLLGNTLGNTSSTGGDESASQQLGAHSLDLERADTVLSDFCKVLDQSQREADYALVLQLGCVGKVLDICSKIKDSMGAQSLATERNMPPAIKQLSSVMLSALKWLGLLSKQKISRVFLLLTNRVVLLVDLAVACLASTPLLEAQNMPSLFLPQALHVLSLHVKQTLPDGSTTYRQKLLSYLLVCGLCEKLRDLFAGAGLRGMKLFHGASPVPLLLLRSIGFLGTLVNAYRSLVDSGELSTSGPSEDIAVTPVLQVFRRTDLFGLIGVLGAILFPEKGKPENEQTRFPQTVLSLAVQAVRILNNVAAIHRDTFQDVLAACQQEFYHLLVCLFDYCVLHQGAKPGQGQCQDESELLHETVALLGFYCLLRKDHQALMCYGKGQTLLAKITSLPLYYFMDEKGKVLLFPTIFATCFGSEPNLELLRNEMNVSLLQNYLAALLQQKEEARLPEAAADGFGGRFPIELWQDAFNFFTD